MEDTNVFRGEAMLFRGWGIQIRHTLSLRNKSLVYCHLPVKIGDRRKLTSQHAGSNLSVEQVDEPLGLARTSALKIDLLLSCVFFRPPRE